MNRLIIESGGQMNKLLYTEEGRITAVDFFEKREVLRKGQIYKGIVRKLQRGMNSALVDLGEGKTGFLQEREIARSLKNGEEVLVQVKREAVEDKYPKLTREIRLLGVSLILFPLSKGLKRSKKLPPEFEVPELSRKGETLGILLRSACLQLPRERIGSEYRKMQAVWEKIWKEFSRRYSPGLLWEEEPILSFLFDRGISHLEELISNDEALIKRLSESLQERVSVAAVRSLATEYVFDYCGLEKDFHALFEKKVRAEGQVSILIEHTQAFTVIDVNSGAAFSHVDFERNVLEANKNAAREIVRQMRLRDVGGVVLIDFIDMKSAESKEELLRYFREQVREQGLSDTSILSMTELCILQLLRKKEKDSLMNRATEVCACCGGSGRTLRRVFAEDEEQRERIMREKHLWK
ncbi:MAG: ribonuclease E/G [Peptostreptococcaceae bacterium]|nr:ribonuclease E/G [Peptostreptococcaceae bacterium]